MSESSNSPLELYYDSMIQQAVDAYGLSQREAEVCRLIIEGLSTEDICNRLYIAPGTFKVHTRNIYGKAHVHSRQELVQVIESGYMQASTQETRAAMRNQ